jgi:hypothetical protein
MIEEYKFTAYYNGHVKNARELLIDSKVETVERVAMMLDSEVEEAISKNYIALRSLDDDKCESIYLLPRKNIELLMVIER